MNEIVRGIEDKTIYTPKDAPDLKIHIYNQRYAIKLSMWKKLVIPEDRLKALMDERGEMWLAINARKHGDITGGLTGLGIDAQDHSATRFQLKVDKNTNVYEMNIPVGYSFASEKAAQIMLKMIPQQVQRQPVILSGSGFYKEIGSDVLTYWGYSLPDIDDNDPRFIEKGIDTHGNEFISMRLNSFPNDLKI
ncbi:MAG TPA: hypothetical protein VD999_03590 [Vitreimonas sp.]|nr:hypothetical protein [Vitreimonas sp.]